MITITFSY